MKRLCLAGIRGHQGYALTGLKSHPDVRLVGLAAATPEDDPSTMLAWLKENGHAPEVVDDYRTLLDRFSPDMISLCGPFEAQADMCAEALRRGIHVFAEKPLAMTMAGLEQVAEAYLQAHAGERPGPALMTMMALRYHPAFHAAWRAVRDGAIGEVRLINANKSYCLGKRAAYYRRRETFPGLIPWVAIHAIDWIPWFAGRPFREVAAVHSARENRDHGDLEVTALCQFRLEDDVLASVTADYLRPQQAPGHGDDRVRVVGTAGVVEVLGGQATLINQHGATTLAPACDRDLFTDFIGLAEGKCADPLIGIHDVFCVTEACLLARQSADDGHSIRFEKRAWPS